MNNPLTSKIAAPYARALFDLAVEDNLMYQFTSDFNNLERFLEKNVELTKYLNNPIISKTEKEEILTKLFKSRLNTETFNFIMVLVKRDRIELLLPIITAYIDSIYELARVRTMELYTAVPITVLQKNTLVTKLKKLTNSREIRLFIYVDPNLIGGFLIKTSSKVIDFTVKNQLKKLAKHLDSVLEI